MKKTILIMAAGMGSRYGGLKQIDGMGPSGEILMEYAVYDAIRAGFERAVFIIKPAMEADFHAQIGSRLADHIEVGYAFQSLDDLPQGYQVPEGRDKPWGTSHAILCAKDAVPGPFAVFNADDFYGKQAFELMAAELDSMAGSSDSAMVGYRISNTLSDHGSVTRGICRSEGGYLSEVVEIAKIQRGDSGAIEYTNGETSGTLKDNDLCSMNFWGFTPEVFNYLSAEFVEFLDARGSEMKSEWLIPTSVDAMVRSKSTRVKVLESGDSWFGVTYPDDKPLVQARIAALVESGVYPSPLFG